MANDLGQDKSSAGTPPSSTLSPCHPVTLSPRHLVTGRRRWLWLALSLGLAAALAGAAGWWYHAPVPAPPALVLDGADPVVAAAIEKERQRVLENPRSAAAWGKLGELLTAFHYWKDALVCFAQAERLDPREPRWPYHQGVLLLLYNPKGAIPRLRRAVELCGDNNPAPRLRLSEALLSLDQLEEAEEGFRLLLKHDSVNARARLGLGRVALQRQQWQEARSHLEAAAADRHSARAAAIALAELHQRQGDENTAEKWRRRAERLPPDVSWPDPFIEEVQRLPIGKRPRLDQANRLLEQGRVAEAITQLNELVKEYPDFSKAWFILGKALYHSGAYPDAEQSLGKVVELTPGYAEAHYYLGVARMRQGKREAAAVAFREAIKHKPDFAQAHINLGRCLLEQKNHQDALSAFRSAVSCMPNSTAAHLELAELLHQTHQDAEALEQVRQALQLNPADERAKQLLEKLQQKRSPSPP
jgi:tetratricopeptide (TPR) repeat protein